MNAFWKYHFANFNKWEYFIKYNFMIKSQDHVQLMIE